MKKILSIFVLGILVLGSLGAVATTTKTNSDFLTIKESISISTPIIEEENEFVTVNLKEGNSYFSNPGNPMLPTINKIFTLPFGSTVYSVEVKYSGEKEILLSKNVKLATEPMLIGTTSQIKTKNNIYSDSQVIPAEKFNYRIGSGISEGEHLLFLTVECYPILYNPLKNILYYHDKIEIYISYSKGITFESKMNEYDLLIISSTAITPTIQNLIDHKNKNNVKTTFKVVNEIYDEYNGRDEPEKIKYFIKDAIETYGISYVLLLGNIRLLPIRHTSVNIWHDSIDIPTDLYYADIYDSYGDFCSWDSNDNDIFGEFDEDVGNIDDVDLYADVMVGRIPYQNIFDLNIVINKIITYENSAYGSDWFKKILLMGGDTFPNHGNIEGEFVTNLVSEEMDDYGFEPIKLWTSENTFKPLNINIKTTAGAGFISYSGHGYEHGFGTSPPNVEQRISYYNLNLIGMINGNKLPIVFFDACSTAILDRKIFDIFNFPGFAYNMVKKSNGGAIAAIGATEVAFTHVDSSGVHGGAGYLNLHFFKNYEDGISLGEMLTKSQYDYLSYVGKDCVTLEEFIIIGDPSLKTGGYP